MSTQLDPESRLVREAVPRILLGDDTTVRETMRAVSRRRMWRTLVGLSDLWRVTPVLDKRLRAYGASLDDEDGSCLLQARAAAAAESLSVALKGTEIMGRLEQAGIRAVAFKGLALMAALYRGAGDRMMADVDLLVLREDVPRAWEVLRAMDFAPFQPLEIERWMRHVRHNPFGPDHSSLVLRHPDGPEIDIHWSVDASPPEEMTTAALIARAEPGIVRGTRILMVNPEDSMILTAHHTMRHNFLPEATMRDLCDLDAWWRLRRQDWSLEKLVRRTRACGLASVMLSLWEVLCSLDPASPAREGADRLVAVLTSREREDALRLRQLFAIHLREQRVNQDLLLLSNPRALREMLLSRILHPLVYRDLRHRGRPAHLYRGAPRPARPRGSRFVEFARYILRHHPSRWSVCRALARQRRSFQGSQKSAP